MYDNIEDLINRYNGNEIKSKLNKTSHWSIACKIFKSIMGGLNIYLFYIDMHFKFICVLISTVKFFYFKSSPPKSFII